MMDSHIDFHGPSGSVRYEWLDFWLRCFFYYSKGLYKTWIVNWGIVNLCATDFPKQYYLGFEIRVFLSHQWVALPKLNNLPFLTIYPFLKGEDKDPCISQGH